MIEEPNRASANQLPELEATLRSIGQNGPFPPTPDLWPGVRQAIQPSQALVPWTRGGDHIGSGRPGRCLIAAAIVLLVLAGAALVFPDVRTAVADRLGLSGVSIRLFDEPPPTVAPVGSALELGRPVTLAEAAEQANFPLRVPTAAGLSDPTEVYITFGQAQPMVSFVYPATERLPASRYTGVGALISQFRGHVERGLISKGIMADSAVTQTNVNGMPAFWIDGASHFFLYESDSGEILSEEYRLAGNVLLWETDGVTNRIEAELPMDDAVAIAESMAPLTEAGTN